MELTDKIAGNLVVNGEPITLMPGRNLIPQDETSTIYRSHFPVLRRRYAAGTTSRETTAQYSLDNVRGYEHAPRKLRE